MSRLSTLFDPPRFQSARRRGGWFEGWYFKLVDPGGAHPLAIIPGISHDAAGKTSHSFVQLIRPGGVVRYLRMPYGAFSARDDKFEITVGASRFSASRLSLDLPATADGPAVRGRVSFGPLARWPVTWRAPGIMGWYRYVPFMQCYHGIVSLDHTLEGSLLWGHEQLAYSGGRGYSEKDWGTGFPSSWIWAQCNHFVDGTGVARPGVALTLSVAKIPWLGSSFVGHIAGLLVDGRLYRFTTYTGARLTDVVTRPGGAMVVLQDHHHRLTVELDGAVTGALKAPVAGVMSGRADEAIDATVHATLTNLDGAVVFDGAGYHAGVEVMDERGELRAGLKG